MKLRCSLICYVMYLCYKMQVNSTTGTDSKNHSIIVSHLSSNVSVSNLLPVTKYEITVTAVTNNTQLWEGFPCNLTDQTKVGGTRVQSQADCSFYDLHIDIDVCTLVCISATSSGKTATSCKHDRKRKHGYSYTSTAQSN